MALSEPGLSPLGSLLHAGPNTFAAGVAPAEAELDALDELGALALELEELGAFELAALPPPLLLADCWPLLHAASDTAAAAATPTDATRWILFTSDSTPHVPRPVVSGAAGRARRRGGALVRLVVRREPRNGSPSP
jgi:hypothetical protein